MVNRRPSLSVIGQRALYPFDTAALSRQSITQLHAVCLDQKVSRQYWHPALKPMDGESVLDTASGCSYPRMAS